MKIFIGESSADAIDETLIEAAVKIGEYLGENNHTYIQGNCIKGLMGCTYTGFKKYNSDIVMYGMDGDSRYEYTKELLDTFDKRTMAIIDNCDIAIFLPGGDCTIQEISTFNQYNREHPSSHKLILVNIKGFYTPLIQTYKNIINEGLNKDRNFFDSFVIVNNIEECIEEIEKELR